MRSKISVNLIRLLLLLFFSELVSTPFAVAESEFYGSVSIQESVETHHKLFFSNILLEKAEGEKSEEEGDKFIGVDLVDFSELLICLLEVHTPHFCNFSSSQSFDASQPRFNLLRTFLI